MTYSDQQPQPKTRAATAINLDFEGGGGGACDQSVVDINSSIQHGGQLVEGEGVQVKVVAFTLRGRGALGAHVCHCDCDSGTTCSTATLQMNRTGMSSRERSSICIYSANRISHCWQDYTRCIHL